MNTLKATGFSLLMVTSFAAWGDIPFFYPRDPDLSYFTKPPSWLLNAKGDDGYVMVTAETDLPRNKSCITLGDVGWLKTFFQKEIQLSTSIVVDGFDAPQSGRETMLLTLDGRNKAGGCVLASTAQQLIVPLTLTKKIGPGDPGYLKFTVLVRSTTESKANLVGSAQSMLAVAAVFATGGAAATVSGFSTALTKPAFERAEKFIDLQFGNTLPSQKTTPLTWKEHIYAGVQTIQVPIYLGETKGKQTVPEASEALQNPKLTPAEADKAFTVRLQFRYYKSLFDPSLTDESSVPSLDTVESTTVLDYPNRPEQLNLLQTLMSGGATSNLLQRLGSSSGSELAEACSDALRILSRSGLNKLDRAITLKASLDVANKGIAWYGNAKYESCFAQHPDIRKIIRQVYGDEPSIRFVNLEAQSMSGVEPAIQKTWEESVPILSRIQRALRADISREELMMAVAANDDIALSISSAGWPAIAATGSDAVAPSARKIPGIQRLVAKQIKSAGCFMAGAEPEKENAMLLLDEQDEVWLARFGYGALEGRKIQSVDLSKLDSTLDWRTHVSRLKNGAVFPENGECRSRILPKIL